MLVSVVKQVTPSTTRAGSSGVFQFPVPYFGRSPLRTRAFFIALHSPVAIVFVGFYFDRKSAKASGGVQDGDYRKLKYCPYSSDYQIQAQLIKSHR